MSKTGKIVEGKKSEKHANSIVSGKKKGNRTAGGEKPLGGK